MATGDLPSTTLNRSESRTARHDANLPAALQFHPYNSHSAFNAVLFQVLPLESQDTDKCGKQSDRNFVQELQQDKARGLMNHSITILPAFYSSINGMLD